MSKGNDDRRRRRLTDEELSDHVRSSLQSIMKLCAIYDGGHPYIIFTISNDVARFISIKENIRLRVAKTFLTIDIDHHPENVAPYHKLIAVQLNGADPPDVPQLECIPRFRGGLPNPTKKLDFVNWWSRDVIFRASAAPAGFPPGNLPTRAEDTVPFAKRPVFTRRTFITLMRNTLGSHLDPGTPEALDQLQKAQSLGIGFQCTVGARVVNSFDGSLPTKTSPAAAMVRQIAHELLAAYEVS